MPINAQEAEEILKHTRTLVRKSTLAVIDDQALGAALDGDPDRQLIRYVEAFEQAIAARGGYGLTTTLHELNKYVQTPNDIGISDIEVAFDDQRTRAFGTDRLVLETDGPLRRLAQELREIRNLIERELLPPRGDHQ